MGKDYTNKGEYQGNEHSADVFKAPKKKLTKEERKQQSDMKKRKYLDTGELDTKGNPLLIEKMDPKMRESYEKNKGNPEFNKEMEAFRKGKKNLTDEEIIDRLNKNKRILQIGQTIYQTGRNALAIGNGLWQFSRALSGFK
tara:strand:- start:463 stop:885 length:423 start_codon:yes stop_codon:yes gene_type:complete